MLISPPILVPRLDLGLAETQRVGHVTAVRHAQVLLAAELALQVRQLSVCEGGAAPARLAARALPGAVAGPAAAARLVVSYE